MLLLKHSSVYLCRPRRMESSVGVSPNSGLLQLLLLEFPGLIIFLRFKIIQYVMQPEIRITAVYCITLWGQLAVRWCTEAKSKVPDWGIQSTLE
jgi:hypothetical protein